MKSTNVENRNCIYKSLLYDVFSYFLPLQFPFRPVTRLHTNFQVQENKMHKILDDKMYKKCSTATKFKRLYLTMLFY